LFSQCEEEADISRQQFVPMSGLQNLMLKTEISENAIIIFNTSA